MRELCEALLADGSVVAFPRVTGPGVMELVAARSWAELEPGTFGIAEPTGEEIVDAADLDVILLPGVAFDRRGGRLGFGGGYYDRALERVRAADARGKKIPFLVGVGYHWQLLDEHLPVEDHDVRVDAVVTDRGITRCRQDAREDSS